MSATLIRLLGDFDLAEEVTQEDCHKGFEQWPRQGVPGNPRAWLVSTARNKAVDLMRRRMRFEKKQDELQSLSRAREQLAVAPAVLSAIPHEDDLEDAMLGDDRLRLIFTCCHPALRTESQVALTLRTLCGLSTEEIAKAFLSWVIYSWSQRIVRAKGKIRDARIPYRVPPADDLAERLAAVMLVVYLVFNEGYNAASGDAVIRRDLCCEAIRLGRLLCELLPGEAEAGGLLALMLLHDSRRESRMDASGEILLLEEQDRRRWNQAQIREGLTLVEAALRGATPGPYAVQAAIAAVHAWARNADETDWTQIAALYDVLLGLQRSPVVELNRAVAVAMARGAAQGLRLLDEIEKRGELRGYYLLPAAQADLARRLEQWSRAAEAYRRALALVTKRPSEDFSPDDWRRLNQDCIRRSV